MKQLPVKEPDLFDSYELNKPRRLLKRIDLKPINNLKALFREVRDYFAGNVTGITRDEKIAENIMRLLFCKVYDEKSHHEIVEFANRPNETLTAFHSRLNSLFKRVKAEFPDIFEQNEILEINPEDLSFITKRLEEFSVLDADRDVIGDAFEELIGTSFRGGEGQFFTPRNVVQMMIEVLQPKSGERILDPACGSGGFLAHTLRHLMAHNAHNYFIAGIDKDAFLARIAKIYLSLLGNGTYGVFCENSLDMPSRWHQECTSQIPLGSVDVILTNPPFGAKIPVVGRELLGQYRLGHQWQEVGDRWMEGTVIHDKQPPQVLFIERCIQFLRENGRLGIVLPEGIFGNPSDKYIWEYISRECSVMGVVSLAQETFQPSTHTKTSVLFLRKTRTRPKSIFMAIACSVGHNKNGKPSYKMKSNGMFVYDQYGKQLINDDLPAIGLNFQKHLNDESVACDHLGFSITHRDLNDHIYIPEYYNPEIKSALAILKKSGAYDLISIDELLKNGIVSIRRGNEVGSQFYGTGEIPFVRTSDIVNWEIKFDPIKAVSDEVYELYRKSQDIRENDILFVNDGTFLIGRTALVTQLDLKIIIQSHIRKLRVTDTNAINPFYLFYLLNSKIVRRQIDAKTFVQATISTIGNRLNEVILPLSKNKKEVQRIASEIESLIKQKARLREKTMKIVEEAI